MTRTPVAMRRMLAILLPCALLAGCSGKPADPGSAEDTHAHAEGEAHEDEAPTESTRITDAQARAAGIVSAAVGPGTIADEHEVQGLLAPVDGRSAQVTARFPGPVRALRANVGDRVRAGQPLASIESNLSLTTYSIAAPISGVVLSRQVQLGAVAAEGQVLFDIGDLSQLWVDLHIFGADTQHITAGVPVTITRMTDGITQTATLERVLPGTATASQSTVARATIDNADGLWRPGAAVRARIVVASTPAPLAVPLTALQSLEGKDVVFVREGDTYQARVVQLGARDARQVAVTAGLQAGEQVVVEQSYTVKADIGKAGAAHEH
ncbi:efflux RND transporter periplasmic adaptor subunit [Stenotrophomonas sp. SORGH_AS_0321]|uniref:efflux RND transporter periplasmic adaptor subunit n=1 Tax=Stenotrophomonas sp. SORGH_AS_0321 TaxID=3041787 RepID=UPI0028551183|nr:efflux RND transporter periplasmic adaptor subunit [Stenotrophomonas sp. SORGH_AS_0321]MDR6092801.1 cobalt-zinc-cadmium efflux system membrane fusion protein [Stenotrophomonas sp. SORGH_AS_0321]